MSVDYYTRLEQARGPRPSAQVLDALARALRLSEDERTYLFHLVGSAPGPGAGPRRDVPAGILHLLDRLDDTPAMVLDAKSDILAWNDMMCAALRVDFSAFPERERNAIAWAFQPGRPVADDDADGMRFVRESVADLRAAVARYPADPGVRRLVAELSARSPLFTALWAEHDVEVRRSSTKRIAHPVVGTFEVDCETLHIQERDQRLVIYTAAPGTPSHEALRLLKVVGLQDLRVSGRPG
jgi:transcriptional regulator with XRE-family HTH domain